MINPQLPELYLLKLRLHPPCQLSISFGNIGLIFKQMSILDRKFALMNGTNQAKFTIGFLDYSVLCLPIR